ncbi:hypothetical protein RB195_010594 [Necator americanus]|uniref:Uncharacterized protein n=1 Tax=Necator americanus TaxID=51031 RepID=A0ABR1CYM6_NECAM
MLLPSWTRRTLSSDSRMDAETLRTVLEAQTKAPQQMFTEMMKRMERMASASSPAVPTTGSMGSASITPSTFVRGNSRALKPSKYVYLC